MEIELIHRTAKVTNLNFQPEKAGDSLVERVDMSLEFLLEYSEIDQIIRTTFAKPVNVLWDDKGMPTLLDLGVMPLDIVAVGVAVFGESKVRKEKCLTFEAAKLKKVSIEPIIGTKATMRCQVRIVPGGHLEDLGRMRIDTSCQFSFKGAGEKEKDDDQGKLNV